MAADIGPLDGFAWHVSSTDSPGQLDDVRVAIHSTEPRQSGDARRAARIHSVCSRVIRLAAERDRPPDLPPRSTVRAGSRSPQFWPQEIIDDSLDWNIDIEGVGHAICTTRMAESSDPRHGSS